MAMPQLCWPLCLSLWSIAGHSGWCMPNLGFCAVSSFFTALKKSCQGSHLASYSALSLSFSDMFDVACFDSTFRISPRTTAKFLLGFLETLACLPFLEYTSSAWGYFTHKHTLQLYWVSTLKYQTQTTSIKGKI